VTATNNHAPSEFKDVAPAITEEQAKVYTFPEWLKERLLLADPTIEVREAPLDRLDVYLHGDWHIMTVYAPPTSILPEFVDMYPRQVQTETMRQAIFAINAWYRFETDMVTGESRQA